MSGIFSELLDTKGWKLTDVSEGHVASIFKVKETFKQKLFAISWNVVSNVGDEKGGEMILPKRRLAFS